MGTIDLQPDLDGPQGAIAFLKHWTNEPLIFASRTDAVTGAKGAFEAKQFLAPVDWDKVREWIAAHQKDGSWSNMYFSVNTALGEVNKKLGRADIRDLIALHIDKDIEPGEDQATGIERIVGIFQKYKHPPTDIVTSGGGAQAFWRLETPVPINGDLTVAEDLKLYNKAIESDLDGDHCHSLDHIMRLPGTVNIPSEIKLAKGRKPRLAVWFSTSSKTYPLGVFTKAEPEAISASKHAGFKTPEAFKPVASDGEEFAKLDKKWLRIGVEGDTEGKFAGDRSRMALAFVTACKRAGIPDDTIANALMDPNWKVGECIRDKGGETRRQLRRILERGGKFVDEDMEKPAVLGMDTWMKTAGQFLVRKMPDLVFFNGEWHVYKGGVFIPTEEGTIRQAVRAFLNESMAYSTSGKDADAKTVTIPFNPNTNDVTECLNAVKDSVHLDRDACEQPCWLNGTDDRPDPRHCINCTNGILHVPTGNLLEHTPDFFTANMVEFAHDPNAQCPLWRATLDQYWPPKEDGTPADEVLLLQEMFGYSLLPWTSLQKIFAVIGPGGSGKGTIMKVLTWLVGRRNVAAPTLDSLGKGEFGVMPLVHKLLAVIGEAGFGPRTDRTTVTNLLKTISGEDVIEVRRMYVAHWVGRLVCRFWLFGNKIPEFDDAGKALLRRLIPLEMTLSFAGKEDKHLGDKLLLELPGIMNWAIEGFTRLTANDGNFTMPESTLAKREEFGRLASPVQNFIEECFDMNPKCHIKEDDIYEVYTAWSERAGQKPRSRGKILEDVCAYDPANLKRFRAKFDNDGVEYKDPPRPRTVLGLRLKAKMPARRARNDGEIPF
jgi:P4 family phage/plasmid primase-like protien